MFAEELKKGGPSPKFADFKASVLSLRFPADAPAAAGGGAAGGGGRGGGSGVVLPSGWEQKQDGSGTVFYIDHNTMTTHWDPPAPA